MNNLFLFVEGTTTNGKGLLSFKKGAFICGGPIKISVLKYGGHFNPCLTMIEFVTLMCGVLGNLMTPLTIQQSDVAIYKSDENMSWEEYAEEVRTLMCNEFGLEKYEGDA